VDGGLNTAMIEAREYCEKTHEETYVTGDDGGIVCRFTFENRVLSNPIDEASGLTLWQAFPVQLPIVWRGCPVSTSQAEFVGILTENGQVAFRIKS